MLTTLEVCEQQARISVSELTGHINSNRTWSDSLKKLPNLYAWLTRTPEHTIGRHSPSTECKIYESWTNIRHCHALKLSSLVIISISLLCLSCFSAQSLDNPSRQQLLGNEDFTFAKNGSFIQIDAGREWPFNSKREISFRFKTKSPHGLLIYQTFDHNRLNRDEEQEILEPNVIKSGPPDTKTAPLIRLNLETEPNSGQIIDEHHHQHQFERTVRSIHKLGSAGRFDEDSPAVREAQLTSSTITATASAKLVNSLFSATNLASTNNAQMMRPNSQALSARDKLVASAVLSSNTLLPRETLFSGRSRVLSSLASSGLTSDDPAVKAEFEMRSQAVGKVGSTVISSSTINSFSASLYELYLKLENGRLKIVYEFGSRLNQTYCGKGLNDDRWHRIDLKVDPELNQMTLVLDQVITVESVLSQAQQQQQQDDSVARRNELVFTNSVLYLGGLNNNASVVKSVRQRLYLAQFIGCIGNIMLKTDQATEQSLQPAPINRAVLVSRGCRNLCDTKNYCPPRSACVNFYTHTRCDCFGTDYEDIYCWKKNRTTLSMFGYSTLVYRIYDWRDRHHSNINRFSMQFKTLASDAILFFAYGDLSAQQALRASPGGGASLSSSSSLSSPAINSYSALALALNITSFYTVHRPSVHQVLANNNYLAISLSNGSIVAEINFGDQPILLSSSLYEKTDSYNQSKASSLADGRWHNVTFIHNAKQITLHVDQLTFSTTVAGKNNHLYFDPSIYVGSVPNFLLNETRALVKPLNLRSKFVGCLRSVYFNHHDIVLALKHNSPMVEYRDIIGKPELDSCVVSEPSSLPLTLRSGKSYLTFQLNTVQKTPTNLNSKANFSTTHSNLLAENFTLAQAAAAELLSTDRRRLTWIEFDYKTLLQEHFLAGGHLRDLSYHDLGGFWTLHARSECRLFFTISSGLTYDPEQVLILEPKSNSCKPGTWYRVSISIVSGQRTLEITRVPLRLDADSRTIFGDQEHGTYTLDSSVELLHQVQLGGDLAKFGETSSIPFSGCIRRIRINGNSFDSRDLVSPLTLPIQEVAQITSANSHNSSSSVSLRPANQEANTNRMAQGYVTIDSCQLVNPCATLNPCKNGGVCRVNELGDPDCDCSKTGYTGRRCHFSIYKRSCQDLFLSGQRKSSHYLIDLDRNGPLKPIRVRCNMESDQNQIETSLSHNLPAEYLIRRSATNDIVLDITYLAFHHMYTHDGFYLHDDTDRSMRDQQSIMLRSMIEQSLFCKQYFRHECRSAPLFLGNKTWMEVPYPTTHRLSTLDGLNFGKCACASSDKKCLDPNRQCNCDSAEPNWAEDSVDLIEAQQVGITRVVMLKQDSLDSMRADTSKQDAVIMNTESQSRITLSDLRCYGTREHGNQHVITFKTSDAYIEVPGWRRGDISFSFRTASNPPAIVLYQLATSRNHGYFRLTLMTDYRLLFEFIVNRKPRKLTLTTAHKLNNGEWQQVFIEYDSANLRLTVNDDSIFVDLDSNDHLGTFEGPLFIGGAPSKYLIGELSRRNGFTGCFKGLSISGRSIDLNDYLSPSMPSVIGGCQPSCTKNLCQNGGKCIEYWGSYECECSNPIAHSGSNCEINLNTNSITFLTPESHYVEQSNDTAGDSAPYLTKSILLSIRTYQESSLVLYAYDRLNNFIQLHKNGTSVVLTFNSNNTITLVRVPIGDEASGTVNAATSANTMPAARGTIQAPIQELSAIELQHNATNSTSGQNLAMNDSSGPASTARQANSQVGPSRLEFDKSIKVSNTSGSGQPIQIKIERHRLHTIFYVNSNFVLVEKPLMFLTNYSSTPWMNPELELVRPTRGKQMPRALHKLYLANIDESFSTRLPGFTGCIQGLSIDNQLFDFNRAHLRGDLRGDYRIGCKMHCDSFPCKNQGTCIENWQENSIQCKCDSTSYIGRLCDEDIAANFNGKTSHFIYNLSKDENQGAQLLKPFANNSSSSVNNTTQKLASYSTSAVGGGATSAGYVNFLDVSFAFSTDSNQSSADLKDGIQVLLLITKANSTRHFFLGLTSDGGLMIQEDFGNSMSLSRMIKNPDLPFNDGYRHMIKYSRVNQTIQIEVDHQMYLPTMSVITTSPIEAIVSRTSLLLVGTSTYSYQQIQKNPIRETKDSYIDFSGCISNLIVRIDGSTIEPFSEAFGQNLETINIKSHVGDDKATPDIVPKSDTTRTKIEKPKTVASTGVVQDAVAEDYLPISINHPDPKLANSRLLDLKDSDQEVSEVMKTIMARDVEQGECASFKRIGNNNEKRSVNEPKYSSMLEPRPAYMDPPRIKQYEQLDSTTAKLTATKGPSSALFNNSLIFLTIVLTSVSLYAVALQIQYISEKFKCETPFFHNERDLSVRRARGELIEQIEMHVP